MSQAAYDAFLADLRAEPGRCPGCGFHPIQGHRAGCKTPLVNPPTEALKTREAPPGYLTAYATGVEDVPLPDVLPLADVPLPERPW